MSIVNCLREFYYIHSFTTELAVTWDTVDFFRAVSSQKISHFHYQQIHLGAASSVSAAGLRRGGISVWVSGHTTHGRCSDSRGRSQNTSWPLPRYLWTRCQSTKCSYRALPWTGQSSRGTCIHPLWTFPIIPNGMKWLRRRWMKRYFIHTLLENSGESPLQKMVYRKDHVFNKTLHCWE